MLNILIAVDNNNLVELIFKEIVRKNKEFRLSDYTYNREDMLDSILQYFPDVIIIDLQILKKNEISIIDNICSIRDGYLPYIIIVSNVKTETDPIYKKQVYAIIEKDESISNILESIGIHLGEIYKEINNNEIYSKVKKELNKFKLNISNKGTDYLIDSILLSYNKENLNLTKDIYPVLSNKYQVTPMNIKWNMEKNIKSMKRYTETDVIEEYFHVDSRSNLTIKTVIRTISDNIAYK